MREFDFSTLYRSTVGFDNLFRLMDSLSGWDNESGSYPPYNIEKTDEDHYRISMAVAGFGEDDLNLELHGNTLVVSGNRGQDGAETTYLHRGIATRAFERRFELADHIQVQGASLANGLLVIDLVRVIPEELKPRKIEIRSGNGKLGSRVKKLIEGESRDAA